MNAQSCQPAGQSSSGPADCAGEQRSGSQQFPWPDHARTADDSARRQSHLSDVCRQPDGRSVYPGPHGFWTQWRHSIQPNRPASADSLDRLAPKGSPSFLSSQETIPLGPAATRTAEIPGPAPEPTLPARPVQDFCEPCGFQQPCQDDQDFSGGAEAKPAPGCSGLEAVSGPEGHGSGSSEPQTADQLRVKNRSAQKRYRDRQKVRVIL